MASAGGSEKNLVDEFEDAFKSCYSALVSQDNVALHSTAPEESKAGVEQAVKQFLELSKQLETYFLQKQMMFSIARPDWTIKDELDELRAELTRKEALLQKHQNKVQQWMANLEFPHPQKPPQTPPPHMTSHPIPARHPAMQSPSAGYPTKASPRGAGGSSSGAPLSGPLAHLEQATSNLGASFERR